MTTTDIMLQSYLFSSILTLSLTYSWYSFYGVRIFFKFLEREGKTTPKTIQVVPDYMWDIYNNGINSSEIDVVRGIHPKFISSSSIFNLFRNHRRRQLEFNIPKPNPFEVLTTAEVRITANALQNSTAYFQLYLKSNKWIFLDEKKVSNISEKWISLRVTSENISKPGTVTFVILTLFENRNCRKLDFLNPVLLLSYFSGNKKERIKRNLGLEDYEEQTNMIWGVEKRPRERNGCRRTSLYIKFSEIDYDSWIVAPSGYEAFQCVGKCTFPIGEHLTPTKHSIIQTLLHNTSPWKTSRACCVPTRLDPISILYVDENGVLTYRFRYRDMVVAECGCR